MALPWLLLAIAIVIELCATAGVKLSDGFTRPLVTVGVLAGYGLSFFLMSRAVKAGLEISIGYAVWSGVGTAAVALIGAAWLDEPLTWPKAAGIGLVVAGVVLLMLSDRS
ncbi:MAG: DMT family transporter [Gaiella sp.]